VKLEDTGCRRRNVLKEDLVGRRIFSLSGLVSSFGPGRGAGRKDVCQMDRRGLARGSNGG